MPADRFQRIPQSPPPSSRAALLALLLLCGLLAIILFAREKLGSAASGCYGRFAPPPEASQPAPQPQEQPNIMVRPKK